MSVKLIFKSLIHVKKDHTSEEKWELIESKGIYVSINLLKIGFELEVYELEYITKITPKKRNIW